MSTEENARKEEANLEEARIQNILTSIILTALEDGTITEEESAMLKQIKLDMKNLKNIVFKAQEDGIITDEEREELDAFRKKLIEDAYKRSREDFVITKDERAIISKLIELLIHKNQTLSKNTKEIT